MGQISDAVRGMSSCSEISLPRLFSLERHQTRSCSNFTGQGNWGSRRAHAARNSAALWATPPFLDLLPLKFVGTVLDRVWALNPRAYNQFSPLGRSVGVPFLILSLALAVAGLGWFKRRRWGWQLAVVVIFTQVLGDFVNVVRGQQVQGGIGIAIAGALLVYLLRPKTRSAFVSGQDSSGR
jgi:hypothetical protein